MEHQMEKKMEHEMETGSASALWGLENLTHACVAATRLRVAVRKSVDVTSTRDFHTRQ